MVPGGGSRRWLLSKLLPVEGVTPGVEPFMEDWGGWEFGLRVEGVWFWIQVWPSLDQRGTWIIGVEPSPGLLGAFKKRRTRSAKASLCDAINLALASAQEVTGRRWVASHPHSGSCPPN